MRHMLVLLAALCLCATSACDESLPRAVNLTPTLKTGEVYYRTGGDTHAAKNVDDHRYHEILVELKG